MKSLVLSLLLGTGCGSSPCREACAVRHPGSCGSTVQEANSSSQNCAATCEDRSFGRPSACAECIAAHSLGPDCDAIRAGRQLSIAVGSASQPECQAACNAQ